MDSETAIDRRYADLTMIIRPDKRHGSVFDVLIEFKFVTLKDAGMARQKARELSKEALEQIPEITKQMAAAEKQVADYGKRLEQKYDNLRLQKFVVVALGFERVCFKRVM